MAEVDTAQIEQVVTDIVNNAHKDGSIDELTPRMIRSRAEERLGLEGGTLDAWKEVVKRAATRAIDALDDDAASSATASSEEEVKPAKTTPKPKPKSKAASSSAKRKSTIKKDEDEGTPPSKKPRTSSIGGSTTTKAATKKTAAKEAAGKKNGKVVRSASVIPSSDDEDKHESPIISSSPGKGRAKQPKEKEAAKEKLKPKRPPLPKNTSAHDADVSTAEVGDGEVEPTLKDGAKPTSEVGAKLASKKAGKGKSKLQNSVTAEDEGGESVTADDESVGADDEEGGEAGAYGDRGDGAEAGGGREGAGEKSESEMSVLIDEEPKKSRSKGKKEKEPVSPDLPLSPFLSHLHFPTFLSSLSDCQWVVCAFADEIWLGGVV
ncbi:hypothetical protein BC629DRAFT_902013 [Irpex lacteus]|nr:hypothetical protein BC629DRAFT_902013 [Irpex lacteus]